MPPVAFVISRTRAGDLGRFRRRCRQAAAAGAGSRCSCRQAAMRPAWGWPATRSQPEPGWSSPRAVTARCGPARKPSPAPGCRWRSCPWARRRQRTERRLSEEHPPTARTGVWVHAWHNQRRDQPDLACQGHDLYRISLRPDRSLRARHHQQVWSLPCDRHQVPRCPTARVRRHPPLSATRSLALATGILGCTGSALAGPDAPHRGICGIAPARLSDRSLEAFAG